MKRAIAVVLAVVVAVDAQRPAPNRPTPALIQAGTNTTTAPTDDVRRPTNMPSLSPMTPFPTEAQPTYEPTNGDSEVLTREITEKPSFSMPMTVVIDCFSAKSGKAKGGKKNDYSGGTGRNYGYAGDYYGGASSHRCGKSGKTKGGKSSGGGGGHHEGYRGDYGGNNYGYGGNGGSSWGDNGGKSGKTKGGKYGGSSWGKSGKGNGVYYAGTKSGKSGGGGNSWSWGHKGSSWGKTSGGGSSWSWGNPGKTSGGAGGSKGGKSGGGSGHGRPSSWGYYDGNGYYYRRDLTSENELEER